MKVVYEKKSRSTKDIIKTHKSDSGLDVFATEQTIIRPGERFTFSVDIKFKIKKPLWMYLIPGLGLEIQIRPKSSKSYKGVDVSFGTVDEGYRGFVHVTFRNNTQKYIKIKKGEKIAQAVLCPVFNRTKFVEGKVDDKTSRGKDKFGSTGRF